MNVLKRLTLAAILLLPGTAYAVDSVNQDMINVAAAIQLYKKECPGLIPDEMVARYELVAKVAGPDAVPSSSVKLDKFIYNPNASAGQVILNATKGSFRFSTGAQSKGDVKVKTPYGTLGVRG
jgi:hypothetical protein